MNQAQPVQLGNGNLWVNTSYALRGLLSLRLGEHSEVGNS